MPLFSPVKWSWGRSVRWWRKRTPSSARDSPPAPPALPPIPVPRRVVRAALLLLGLVVLLLTLHYRVLPAVMGYYNDDCYMHKERRERMRFVLRHVVTFLNDENATYWLDFGTLLGAVRERDIMAHDGDMDVSRLADDLQADTQMMLRFASRMLAVGIEGTEMVAKSQGVQVDMFRWQTFNDSSGQRKLRKYFPFVPAVRLAESFSDYLFPTEVLPSVLFPLRHISVFGINAKIPHRTLDFIKSRYPLTWFMNFPYKWKCWTGG